MNARRRRAQAIGAKREREMKKLVIHKESLLSSPQSAISHYDPQ